MSDNKPLRRGVDGVCTRSTCECEREGLGDQCVWLRPAEAEFAAQVTGEQAAMQPELALFFRDLRNYLLHVIDMSKGEHYLDVVRLNAQALIRRMELLAAASNRTTDWYMAVVWPLLPVPGEFDGMDECDQSRWRSVVRLAIEYTLAGERGVPF